MVAFQAPFSHSHVYRWSCAKKGDEELEQGRREALASIAQTNSARALRYASQARVILPETVPSRDNTPVSVVRGLQQNNYRPLDLQLVPRSHAQYVNVSLKP
jgi:hypothetical protein